ncbi:MAG: glycosyltransferase [Chloroflexota bacterium]
MAEKARALIFIVSYNAEAFINTVLDRIPEQVWNSDLYDMEVLIIDDQSEDDTFIRATEWSARYPDLQVTVMYNPVNQGYGGNQKIGYHYAIENDFDAVVLLHGDGQYAPEYLDDMIRPLVTDEADVVFGSRMLKRFDALKGKMPLYKWLGNQVLTTAQNLLLGCNLAEFHTGYRAYSTKALASVPFAYNSDYFDFDTDIIIQMLDTSQRIKEIPIPTFYGDEVSYVNGWRYGALIMRTTVQSRLMPRGLLYDRKFDYETENEYYTLKLGYPSSHQFALDKILPGATVLDVGSGPGYMTKALHDKGAKVVSLDRFIQPMTEEYSIRTIQSEVEDYDLTTEDTEVEWVLMLDIIEHLHDPEEFMLKLRSRYAADNPPTVVITTGNVAFFVVRAGLLFGQFNYGKKGILDRDHRRLFTFSSLERTLESTGYDIIDVQGIPAPYPLAVGDNAISRFLIAVNQLLNIFSKGLFAYQIAIVARPRPMLHHLLEHARTASAERLAQSGKPMGVNGKS